MKQYIYATNRGWCLDTFAAHRAELPGDWIVVTSPADLLSAVKLTEPRYVFFPHWSHIVPASVLNSVECVCFHMTDVPYGRGGSPLQNLIVLGHKETKLTALRMTEILDGGPVYFKSSLSLEGPAEEILVRMAERAITLIKKIVQEEPAPHAQVGSSNTLFQHRTPEQSRLPDHGTLTQLHDHVRMLDAPGYPYATLDHGGFRMTFRDSHLSEDGSVDARVTITSLSSEDK